ncbi:MAG: NADH-quinone oxidoreductase subunit C [Anaerolineae bacterium]|nr:NADH-quinone oxidoreductase subunit C [Anaerolineae bacterium]
MNIDRILEVLREWCALGQLDTRRAPLNEVFVSLPSACLRVAVQLLSERFGVHHLSTITGQDVDGRIELLYHFWDGQGLTLRLVLPRERPQVETLIDLIPGAAYYEREIGEMLGVRFAGHEDMQPLFLPDDWDGAPPLRRDFAGRDAQQEGT